ncbi:cobalamin biosynthesis protein [Hoyosella sp. G463]|uniref:Cobalamin biosynthesis protein CobD n=1 Tax=Lolliginicoccus lacisalsi TaxID=2742202 RepID=A0A927JA92_9ACTN|nr:cobalamin biosynthesis protein [Lolliginicoccus lacisalsi]MBD8505568.1 cobalamin biosynthesis protein [Lolliginicoccus lacisalsi]
MRHSWAAGRAAGLALGFLADHWLGDPQRFHPVAGFGTIAHRAEQAWYRDSRGRGAVHWLVLVGGTTGAACLVELALARDGMPRLARIGWTAGATWATLGGMSLARVGERMAGHLEAGDLEAARDLLPSLCGRDPALLDLPGIARATVESIAENTSDATIGPLVWAGLLGAPGALAYRAINTLDAMVGYRSERYGRFGWFSARADDAANLLPARCCGMITVASAPVVGGSPARSWRAWRRDARSHPSPNAGVAEASAAGALGIRLGGTTRYWHGTEERPALGEGPPPRVADVRRAVRLSRRVQAGAAVLAVLAVVAVPIGQRIARA